MVHDNDNDDDDEDDDDEYGNGDDDVGGEVRGDDDGAGLPMYLLSFVTPGIPL